MEVAAGGGQQRRRHPGQVVHGDSGLLLDDPGDQAAFGAAVQTLAEGREAARRMGARAHTRACEHYLAPRRLGQELELVEKLAG